MLLKTQRLKYALKKDNIKTAQSCIKDGAILNDKWLAQFLYINIKKNNSKVIQTCIEAGINIETIAGREYQETILHVAARHQRFPLVQYLLSKGAKADTYDKDNTSALFDASDEKGEKSAKIVKLLIKHGAQINHQTHPKNRTALMRAALKGVTETVKILIDLGADLSLTDSDNKTAWDLSIGDTRQFFPEHKMQQHQESQRQKMTQAEKALGIWEPAFNKSIAFVQTARKINKELTEIFNFSAQEITIILRNTKTNIEHCSKEKFIQYADKKRLETACTEYNKLPNVSEKINPDDFMQMQIKTIDGQMSVKAPVQINKY